VGVVPKLGWALGGSREGGGGLGLIESFFFFFPKSFTNKGGLAPAQKSSPPKNPGLFFPTKQPPLFW